MRKHLSVPPGEMVVSLERLQDDAKAHQRTIRGFQEKLAAHEAATLLAHGATALAECLDGWDAQGLKSVAAAFTSIRPNAAVVLFTSTTPAQVVVARGPESSVDAAAVLKQLTAKFGGKGGGKADLAQGGGLNGSATELTNTARDLLTPHR
jgi:alanyl-tRNA synthetase